MRHNLAWEVSHILSSIDVWTAFGEKKFIWSAYRTMLSKCKCLSLKMMLLCEGGFKRFLLNESIMAQLKCGQDGRQIPWREHVKCSKVTTLLRFKKQNLLNTLLLEANFIEPDCHNYLVIILIQAVHMGVILPLWNFWLTGSWLSMDLRYCISTLCHHCSKTRTKSILSPGRSLIQENSLN